jgi:hypothetical protein
MANVVQIVISALNKTGQGLTAPIKDLKSLEKAAMNLKPAFAALAATGAAAAVYMANKFLATADAANKAAQQTGMTTEAFTSLAYAADLGGVNSEAFTKSMAKLARTMADAASNGGASAQAFRELGVSVANGDGTMRGVDQVLLDVATTFQGMQDGATKTAAAMDLFGKEGQKMIPVLNAGAAGLQAMQAEADALGVTISGGTASAAERFNDALRKLHLATQGIVNTVMAEFTPMLAEMAEGLVNAEKRSGILKATAWTLVDIFKALASGAAVVWGAMNAIGNTVAALADTIYSLLAVQVNVAIQLFERWAKAIVEIGRLAKQSGADIATFAQGVAAVARGDWATAAALMSASYVGAKDDATAALAAIGVAAKDSAGIVASNTVQTLGYLGERWKVYAADQVSTYSDMMSALAGINSAGAASNATPRGGSDDAAGGAGKNDGSAWINQIIDDTYKAQEMMRAFEVSTLEGAARIRAEEDLRYQEKLGQINSLLVEEETARQLREAAEMEHQQRLRAMDQQTLRSKLRIFADYAQQSGSIMGSMAQLASVMNKKNFKLSQGLRYGEAIMNTAAGVSRAFAEHTFPYSAVVAAAVGAAGAAQIATIASQQPPSYAVGSEYIPTTGPAIVHQGERIIQSSINADLSDFLDRGASSPMQVTILLDGEVLARALGNMSMDGRLELSARAIT